MDVGRYSQHDYCLIHSCDDMDFPFFFPALSIFGIRGCQRGELADASHGGGGMVEELSEVKRQEIRKFQEEDQLPLLFNDWSQMAPSWNFHSLFHLSNNLESSSPHTNHQKCQFPAACSNPHHTSAYAGPPYA